MSLTGSEILDAQPAAESLKEADRAPKAVKRPRTELWAYLFLAPTVVLFGLFEFFPLGRAVYLSFSSTDIFGRPAGFAGFEHYSAMFTDPDFLNTLVRTFVFTVLTVVLKLSLGLSIALPLAYRLRGTGWIRSVVLIPMAVSVAIGTLVFRAMMAPSIGLFDQLAGLLGFGPVGWLTSTKVALFSVVMVDVWIGISFVVLLLLVAIDNISDDVVEASNLDGATGWRYVRYIVIPGIAPMLLFLAVTQSMAAMKEFTIFNVLTEGGPAGSSKTLVLDIYNLAFGGTANFAAASARGMVLFVLILILTLIQFKLAARK